MKSNKTLLLLQLFSLLPLIVFFFIYSNFSLIPSITMGIFLSLFAYSVYRYKENLILSYTPMLATLVGGFLLYGFSGLGSMHTPQTFETIKAEESVTLLHFNKPTAIDKVCYYVGIDYDSFSLEYQTANTWKKFYTYKKDYPYSFRWKCKSTSIKSTTKILLRPVENEVLTRVTDNELMLGEVHFFHNNQSIPYTTDKQYLNDETDILIDKSYYGGMFFDEIYHGRTAYEIMHNLNVYENTHPYLGKHIIAAGIKVFGMTPFGWRFSNVLFAALLVFMAYYFAFLLFKEHIYGFAAATLVSYSFMHLAQSRIGLIDTFGVTFVFISYYYLYKFIKEQKLSPLLWSGIFFGLAIAIKWSAVFASLGFLLIAAYLLITKYPLQKRFADFNLVKYGLLSYGVLALIVYTLSFFDIFMNGGTLQSVIDYNTNMYNYHSTLIASHPYSSPWWSWPLDLKPMGYYVQNNGDLKSSINAFGNPAIFWTGILAITYVVFAMFRRKSLEASFILLAFIGLYVPYVFVGRLMFIYHFYYAVPFLILAIVYMFKDLIDRTDKFKYILIAYLIIVIGLFLLFYPVLSGYEVPQTFIKDYLMWLPKWWL